MLPPKVLAPGNKRIEIAHLDVPRSTSDIVAVYETDGISRPRKNMRLMSWGRLYKTAHYVRVFACENDQLIEPAEERLGTDLSDTAFRNPVTDVFTPEV